MHAMDPATKISFPRQLPLFGSPFCYMFDPTGSCHGKSLEFCVCACATESGSCELCALDWVTPRSATL